MASFIFTLVFSPPIVQKNPPLFTFLLSKFCSDKASLTHAYLVVLIFPLVLFVFVVSFQPGRGLVLRSDSSHKGPAVSTCVCMCVTTAAPVWISHQPSRKKSLIRHTLQVSNKYTVDLATETKSSLILPETFPPLQRITG